MEFEIIGLFSKLELDITKKFNQCILDLQTTKHAVLASLGYNQQNISELRNNSCIAILKTGQNKGDECCRKTRPNSEYCGYHIPRISYLFPMVPDQLSTQHINNSLPKHLCLPDHILNPQKNLASDTKSGPETISPDDKPNQKTISPDDKVRDLETISSCDNVQDLETISSDDNLTLETIFPENKINLETISSDGELTLGTVSPHGNIQNSETFSSDNKVLNWEIKRTPVAHLEAAETELGEMYNKAGGVVPLIAYVLIPYAWNKVWG